MPNSQTKLKTVREVARALGHKVIKAIKEWQESKPRQETFWLDDVILSGITQDRQHIERVLVERLRVRQSGWLGKEEDGSDRHPCYDELDQAITLVKEVLQGKE